MANRFRYALIFALGCSLLPIKNDPAQAEAAFSQLAIGPDIGTTGIGVRLSTPLLSDLLTLTTGYSGLAFSYHASANGRPWNAQCRLGGAPIYLSAYPLGPYFHLDAGIFINQTRVRLTADMRPGERASGATHFNPVAPYLGLGWGNPFLRSRKWTFTANAGVILEGGARTRLRAIDETTMQTVAENLSKSAEDFNRKMSFMTAFPVAEIGFTYRF